MSDKSRNYQEEFYQNAVAEQDLDRRVVRGYLGSVLIGGSIAIGFAVAYQVLRVVLLHFGIELSA